ncbi:MAG: hypothetical protein ACRC20_12910 [Segniliparus sp.]|uniref:hypothetical protein n=1 Tax=Segniliparus sp. TaxID=2804064 RepID=UPI003F2E3A92
MGTWSHLDLITVQTARRDTATPNSQAARFRPERTWFSPDFLLKNLAFHPPQN